MITAIDFGELGAEAWDTATSSSPDSWFWHSSKWMGYSEAYRPDLRSRNLSFALVDGAEIIALVQAFAETHVTPFEHVEISLAGDAAWSPVIVSADRSRRPEIWKAALRQIDDLALATSATRASMRATPLMPGFSAYLPEILVWTTRSGYLDVSLASQVIDLELDEAALRAAMSKGHRADITRGRRELTVEAFDSFSDSTEAFNAYRTTHAEAAGRVTRPARTFELMSEWIAQGSAVLFAARRGDDWVGFNYTILDRAGAYYASGANSPRAGNLPVGHVLQAEAITWLKAQGFKRYEVGLQHFGNLPHSHADSKEINISKFKRGFGGTLVPHVVREKFYSEDFYREVLRTRSNA